MVIILHVVTVIESTKNIRAIPSIVLTDFGIIDIDYNFFTYMVNLLFSLMVGKYKKNFILDVRLDRK